MHAVSKILSAGSGAALECTQAAHDAFNAELRPILKQTVFQASLIALFLILLHMKLIPVLLPCLSFR